MFKKRIKTKYNYFNRIRPKDYPYYDWYYDFGDSITYAWRDKGSFYDEYDDWFDDDYDDTYECGCCKCCGCDCIDPSWLYEDYYDLDEEIDLEELAEEIGDIAI